MKKFSSNPDIQILQGDSGLVLHDVVPSLQQQSLFWLDGHYSGGSTAKGEKECPIYGELEAILNSNLKHIILIDDARLFVGENDYPTVNELRQFVEKLDSSYCYEQEHDVIRITPAG